ncbi:MAG: hypothetical protein KJO06_12765, partial [Gemmatimonadetes bacterium]|nr:hypothetical protein [Gemmatimonadota bacterium]
MSTKDEQITADESPLENTVEEVAAVTPEETEVSSETEVVIDPPAADPVSGESADTAPDGDASDAAEIAEGDDDGDDAPNRAPTESAVDEEAGWTTLAYGMAEGMSMEALEGGEYSSDEYDEMMALYEDTLSEIAEGEIVKARVLRKTD